MVSPENLNLCSLNTNASLLVESHVFDSSINPNLLQMTLFGLFITNVCILNDTQKGQCGQHCLKYYLSSQDMWRTNRMESLLLVRDFCLIIDMCCHTLTKSISSTCGEIMVTEKKQLDSFILAILEGCTDCWWVRFKRPLVTYSIMYVPPFKDRAHSVKTLPWLLIIKQVIGYWLDPAFMSMSVGIWAINIIHFGTELCLLSNLSSVWKIWQQKTLVVE